MIVYTRLDRPMMPGDYYRNRPKGIAKRPANAKDIRPDIPGPSEQYPGAVRFPHAVP